MMQRLNRNQACEISGEWRQPRPARVSALSKAINAMSLYTPGDLLRQITIEIIVIESESDAIILIT
jgi:hypothetical protein